MALSLRASQHINYPTHSTADKAGGYFRHFEMRSHLTHMRLGLLSNVSLSCDYSAMTCDLSLCNLCVSCATWLTMNNTRILSRSNQARLREQTRNKRNKRGTKGAKDDHNKIRDDFRSEPWCRHLALCVQGLDLSIGSAHSVKLFDSAIGFKRYVLCIITDLCGLLCEFK